MDPNGRRDKTRRIVIITLSAAIAGLTTALAASYERIGMGLAVATGYIILFMSAALVNSFLHNSASDTKRMLCLVFSICVLLLFLGGMVYLLFNQKDDETIKPEITEEIVIPETEEEIEEKTAEPDEIAIPSAPQVMWTVRIDDSSPHPVSEEPSDEISLQDEKSPRDSSETTAVIDSEKTSSESAAIIPEDPIFIGSMIRSIEEEIPSAPVFIESSVKAVEKDPVAIPDTPIFIEASIDEINENETAIVPVIIGGADAEIEIQIEEPVVEESTTINSDSIEEVGIPRDMTSQEHYDDFWSSFFIAGEDELTLLDGEYYMTLFVNGNEVGDITVYITNGVTELVTQEIRNYIGDTITDEAESRIFSNRGDFISIEDFNAAGVTASVDTIGYVVELDFSTEDMPVQVISVRSSSSRFGTRPPVGDAILLDPAKFLLTSRYSLSSSFTLNPINRFSDSLRFTFSSSNTARLFGVYLDFNYSMRFGTDYFDFSMGSYSFHYDFEDSMIRLSWGNVSPQLLSPAGSDIGIKFEKNISYGPVDAKRKSHIERVITIEKESEVVIQNEGREIFRRTLQPGNYRLQDFVLYTGANLIKITVTPTDGSPSYEQDIQLSYSSSLLAPGEIFFGGAIATGRNIVSDSSYQVPGSVRLSLGSNRSLEYDWRNIVISGNIRAGLTQSLTMDAALALQNQAGAESAFRPGGKFALEFTHANTLGTTRYNFNVTEESDEKGRLLLPGLYARVGHQVFTGFQPISAVNLGLTYETFSGDVYDNHRFMLSSSLSGSYGIFSWSLSLSGTLNTERLADFNWNTSATMSFSFNRNFYLSASASIGGVGTSVSYLNGRIGATLRFSPATVTVNASTSDISATARVSGGGHSFSAELATRNPASIESYTLDADYSYSGNYVNVSASLDSADVFNSITGNLSVSTSSVFADGFLVFSSVVPSNFMFIKQEGALKGNTLSVGAAGSSDTIEIPTVFNTGFYKNIPSSRSTSLSVFSMADNAFSGANIFNVYIPERKYGGYILHIEANNVYTVSGVVTLPDGMIWTNGSSPVYIMDDQGENANLEASDFYIFTDSDGRFVMSDLEAGTYAFDVFYEGNWYLYSFTVANADEHVSEVQLLSTAVQKNDDLLVSEPYETAYEFTGEITFITGDAFWEMLYPSIKEAI